MWWLFACDGVGSGDTFFFRDTGTATLPCGTTTHRLSPADGEVDVWWDTPVVFPTDGEQVTISTRYATSSSVNDDVLTLTPEEPWPPATTIDLLFEGCDEGMATRFVTAGSVGPIDPVAIDGLAWSLSDGADYGVLDVLEGLYGLHLPDVLLDGSTLVLDTGADACAGWSGALPYSWANDGAIQVETSTLLASAGSSVPVDVESFFLDFSADTLAPAGLGLKGWVDIDALAAAIGVDAAGICSELSGFDHACEESDGRQLLPVYVDSLVGSPIDGSALVAARDACS